MTTMLSAATTPAGGAPLRTGQNILRSPRNGRQVFVDGELVKDVATRSS